MNRLICITMDEGAASYAQHTVSRWIPYAIMCEASIQLVSLSGLDRLVFLASLAKSKYDHILMVDSGLVLHPFAPSIFKLYPSGFHTAVDQHVTMTPENHTVLSSLEIVNLKGKCLSDSVIFTDKESLEKLQWWFRPPWHKGVSTHFTLSVYSVWPQFVPMDQVWNTADPLYMNPVNGVPITVDHAWLRNPCAMKDWRSKDVYIQHLLHKTTISRREVVESVVSVYCVPRLIKSLGLHLCFADDFWLTHKVFSSLLPSTGVQLLSLASSEVNRGDLFAIENLDSWNHLPDNAVVIIMYSEESHTKCVAMNFYHRVLYKQDKVLLLVKGQQLHQGL